ncbi:hypothetical protein SKAU_G00054890 [Synaphobranchus kaupii]|uniref:Uncharacterized protein n=1 Tax=Synaphobranchus kaupii TaxID=118154 RepID=A0A9Q1J7Y8_SYNKA|nr:hypothetical protein SKAU_G00054890 [Synaphobranchus kaupii]
MARGVRTGRRSVEKLGGRLKGNPKQSGHSETRSLPRITDRLGAQGRGAGGSSVERRRLIAAMSVSEEAGKDGRQEGNDASPQIKDEIINISPQLSLTTVSSKAKSTRWYFSIGPDSA